MGRLPIELARQSTMKTRWQQLLVRATIWLAAEIILTCLGLDDLADYSEFLTQQKGIPSVPSIASPNYKIARGNIPNFCLI